MLAVFLICALGAIAGSLGVLLNRQPVNSAISLVVSFFFLAAIYILLSAQFLAVLQVLVYAGAIMVLFIFVLMLLNLNEEELGNGKYGVHTLVGIAAASAIGVALVSAVLAMPRATERLELDGVEETFGTVEPIGHALLTDYVLPFELVSVLLLVGIVGAVVVAKRRA